MPVSKVWEICESLRALFFTKTQQIRHCFVDVLATVAVWMAR